LLSLFFDPDDGGDMFLQNVGSLPRDYRVISQTIELFTATAVKTSDPTSFMTVFTRARH
jgi:hypothetical protein